MNPLLSQALAWKHADWCRVRMLQSLQGHILKGHGLDKRKYAAIDRPKFGTQLSRVTEGSGVACPFPSQVRLKDGEYFFSPSIDTLKNL